ncbi:MAG: hydroxysqualene dehydroxylase HpnE [Pseudomonadota bacterium]
MKDAEAIIVGAGLAGLAAATQLAAAGVRVRVIDAAAQAGGRCRSYHDPQIGGTIDNGNHLVLSGNAHVMRYLDRIGGRHLMTGPDEAVFRFVDMKTGDRWQVTPNDGPVPWWLLSQKRRVPGAGLLKHAGLARLLRGGRDRTVGELVPTAGPLWDRFLEPILVAALNTRPETGSARLTANTISRSLLRGGRATRPLMAEPTLAAAFVTPALKLIEASGGTFATGKRLRSIRFEGARAAALDFGSEAEALGPQTALILAVPPWIAADLVPDLVVPSEFRPIVNAHFAVPPPPGAPASIGLIGGTAEWIFAFHDRLSVTVSAADHLLGRPREELARTFWSEIVQVHGLLGEMPPWQIVREKRATFAATPAQDARRPGAATRWRNLVLAGDWTQTGLPATIEGAVQSGHTAADLLAASGFSFS